MSRAEQRKLFFGSDQFVLYSLLFLVFFLPTSIMGEQISVLWGLINALVVGSASLLFSYRYGFNRPTLVLAISLLAILSTSSLLVLAGEAGEFSIARFAPVCVVLLIFSVRIGDIHISRANAIRIIDTIITIIIAWNILALIRFRPLIQFVENYYIQLDDYTATEYSLLIGKPVFTFGVHNFAAVFYLFLFYCAAKVFFQQNKIRMLFYDIILVIFTLMLASTAAYGTAAIMIAVFTFELWRFKSISLKWIIVLLAPVAITLVLLNPAVIERFMLSENGFIARYASNELYAGNSVFLSEYPLGAGFTIPYSDKVYLADSGFWINFTMGSYLFLFGICAIFLLYIKNTVHSVDDRLFITVNFFVAELSFSSFLYWKTMALLIIAVIVLNALNQKEQFTEVFVKNANGGYIDD